MRRSLATAALSFLLVTCLPGVAAARTAGPAITPSLGLSLPEELFGWMTRHLPLSWLAKAGWQMDPNGGDQGSACDPNGGVACKQGWSVDPNGNKSGSVIDPNGAGSALDPSGRGFSIDPNGGG